MSIFVNSVSNAINTTKNLKFGSLNSLNRPVVTPSMESSQTAYASSGQFNENLTRKVKIYPITTHISMEGDVNGKPVNLSWHNMPSWLGKKENYKGTFGNNNADITIYDGQINGNVGDKELNIIFNKNIHGDFSITGKIGSKDINIKSGSPTNSALGEEDILTLIAALKGSKFTCYGNTFGKMQTSDQRMRDYGQTVALGVVEPMVQRKIFG